MFMKLKWRGNSSPR